MRTDYRRLIAIVLVIILSLGNLGCGNNSPQQKPTETEKSEKPPPELEKMKKTLAELGTMLEKRRSPEVEIALTSDGKQETQNGGQQDSQSQGGRDSKNQEGNTEARNWQTASGGGEWKQEMELVRSLHRDWNSLEPEAITKGMTASTQTALEENLARLTKAVENRQALEAQLAANQVYRYYIEVAARFKPKIPPNLERVRYHVTEAWLQGEKGSWTRALEEANRALEIWYRFSYSLTKIERRTLNQMEHSLTDLIDAVGEMSMILTSIKTEVALQNIETLEREIKGSNQDTE